MEVDEVVTIGGVADVEKTNVENLCQSQTEEEEEEEEGAEADGGYSSNSCNGGEDHPEGEEGSQDDYDPFNEDGLEQTNGDTECERDIFDSQRNGSTDELESQDDKIIECNQDIEAVLITNNAFLGGAEKHHTNPLEERNSLTFRQNNTSISDNMVTGEFGDESQMNNDDETENTDENEQEGCEEGNKAEHEQGKENELEEQYKLEEEHKQEEEHELEKDLNQEDHEGEEPEQVEEHEDEEEEEENRENIPEEDAIEENGFSEAMMNEDTGGEMSIRIGSVSSIQTVVHDDLDQWGAKLEARDEGEHEEEESEDVWEDGLEKEIHDLNEKEATDSDAEYDEAIQKAMQDSLAKEAEEKGEKEKHADDFYDQANDQEDELTLDGVPEVAETVGFEDDDEVDDEDMDESNPLDDIDPYMDESEDTFDPLNGGADEIGTDENTSGFLDQVNSGALPVLVDLPKQVRGPNRKKRSINDTDYNDTEDDDDSDEDFDEYQPFDDEPGVRKSGSKPSAAKSDKNEVFFKCDVCQFPFETIGQMKIHKYADHENEEKPSFLDLAEAAIMCKKNRKIGVSKNIMLQVISLK